MKIKFTDILKTLAKLTAPPPPRRYPFDNPATLAKANRARARAKERRSMAASTKRGEEMKDERVSSGRGQPGAWGEMMHQVILRAMEPRAWYARTDVVNLTGFERGPVDGKLREMRGRGWLRREQNPEWDPKHHPSPRAIQRGEETKHPQWLYQLTEEGEAERGRLSTAHGSSASTPHPAPPASE